jgi:hypothetical protein
MFGDGIWAFHVERMALGQAAYIGIHCHVLRNRPYAAARKVFTKFWAPVSPSEQIPQIS